MVAVARSTCCCGSKPARSRRRDKTGVRAPAACRRSCNAPSPHAFDARARGCRMDRRRAAAAGTGVPRHERRRCGSSSPSRIATAGSSPPSTQRTSKCATKASRSRSRVRQHAAADPAHRACSTCRAAWRATCRCCAARRAQLFARLRPDDVARVGTFGHDIVISPTFTRDVGTLRAALPTTIAPDAPTPLWRAIDQALSAFDKKSDDRRVGDPGAERRQGQRSPLQLQHRQPGRGHRPRAPRRRDDLRDRHAQPRPPPMTGIGPRRSAGGADRPTCPIPGSRAWPSRPAAATPRSASARISARRSRHRRRAAQPVPARLRAAQARRQGARHRRARQRHGLKPRARKSYVAPGSAGK